MKLINDEHAKQRWLELKFYYFCLDIYEIRENFMDLITCIDALSNIGQFKVQKIRVIAANILKDIAFQPNREEIIILANMNGITYPKINKYTGVARPTYNQLLRDEQKNPRAFYPKLSLEDRKHIQQFMEIVAKVKGAGL